MSAYCYKELEDRIKPNTFITLTAKQGIQTPTGVFIAGSYYAFDKAAKGFWKSVNVKLYGKRAWRRKRRSLPNLTVVERSRAGMWHIHACVRRPNHVTLEQFDEVVRNCWYNSAWSKRIIQVEEYRGSGIRYILKDGQDGILVSSCCFDDDATGRSLASGTG